MENYWTRVLPISGGRQTKGLGSGAVQKRASSAVLIVAESPQPLDKVRFVAFPVSWLPCLRIRFNSATRR